MPDANMTIGKHEGMVDQKSHVAGDGPAVAVPPVTILSPEKMLEQMKAKVKGALSPQAKPADKPRETNSDVEPEDKNKDGNATVPPKVLKELGRLQGKVRELEPKIKEFESLKPDADMAREAKKLWSGTHEDKLKALALLSGKDGLDELASLVKTFYEIEQDKPETTDDKNVSPQMKEVMAKLDAATKIIEELKADKTKEKENETKTAAEKNQERANEYVKGFIDRNKEKFILCARPENLAEAIEDIQDAAMTIIDRDKIDIKTMDQKTAEKVYLEALQETEAEYETTGKRFSKAATETKEFNPDKYLRFVRQPSKPTVQVVKEEPSSDPKVNEQRLRRRLQEKFEAGEYRR